MHPLVEYAFGGLGACGACFFSNPLEVVKTRMQLQGELQGRGSYHRHYRNVFHAFFTIAKHDGLLALQKGLAPGLFYQLTMNGIRLGSYQIIQNSGFSKNADGSISYPKSMLAGAVSGCAGAFVGSPMYLVKTHLQAQASTSIAVGTQHGHQSFVKALLHIFQEHGITGLWRGVTGALMRVTVGSAAQLSSFSKAKEFIQRKGIFPKKSILIPLSASMIGSVVVVCAMTPFDVVSTRLYNQGVSASGKGALYSGFLDCVWKIYSKEGMLAFYKGIGASYFRLGPHTVLSLVFWDTLRETYVRYFTGKDS